MVDWIKEHPTGNKVSRAWCPAGQSSLTIVKTRKPNQCNGALLFHLVRLPEI